MTWVIIVLIVGGSVAITLTAGAALGRGIKAADAHEQNVREAALRASRQGPRSST